MILRKDLKQNNQQFIMKQMPKCLPNGDPWPKISIVTPSYNQGRFLEDMLSSVINQHYPNIEHIIIDGNSTDSTMQVVEKYQDHFSKIVSEPDRGQSDALNKGFRFTTGDILTWLNCDDQLAPGALYSVALAFYYSMADIVAGGCRVFNEAGTELLYHITSCDNGKLPLRDLLDIENYWFNGCFFFQPEVMFTRELWERAGGYIDESLYYCMDYELWVRFAAHGAKIHVVSSPIAYYRMHPQQKTATIEAFRPELTKTTKQLREKYLPGEVFKDYSDCEIKKIKIVFLNNLGINDEIGINFGKLAKACSLAGNMVHLLGCCSNLEEVSSPDLHEKTLGELIKISPDLVVVGNIEGIVKSEVLITQVVRNFPSLILNEYKNKLNSSCIFVDRTQDIEYDDTIFTGNQKSDMNNQFTIRYGVDTRKFFPKGKEYSRNLLELQQNKFIILIQLESLDNPFEFFECLTEAIDLIAAKEQVNIAEFITIQLGNSCDINCDYKISSEDMDTLAFYYAAVDLVIGTNVNEAVLCGTPVINIAENTSENCPEISGLARCEKATSALSCKIEKVYIGKKKNHDSISDFAPTYLSNEYSYFNSYKSLISIIKKVGLARYLKFAPRTQFPASPCYTFHLDYVVGTPNANKARLGHELFDIGLEKWFEMLIEWQDIDNKLSSLQKSELVQTIGKKRIIIFGTGGLYKTVLKPLLDEFRIRPILFIDNDYKKSGTQIDQVDVCLPDRLISVDFSQCYIFVASMYYTEIKEQLLKLGMVEYRNFIKAC